jgi:hypothetical protein
MYSVPKQQPPFDRHLRFGGQGGEVVDSLGDDVAEESNDNASHSLTTHAHIHEHLLQHPTCTLISFTNGKHLPIKSK